MKRIIFFISTVINENIATYALFKIASQLVYWTVKKRVGSNPVDKILILDSLSMTLILKSLKSSLSALKYNDVSLSPILIKCQCSSAFVTGSIPLEDNNGKIENLGICCRETDINIKPIEISNKR